MADVLSPTQDGADVPTEIKLRPKKFDEFIGQRDLIDRLNIAMTAAEERKEAMDHILLCSPPGLGKTSIATVLSNECKLPIKTVTATSITCLGELISLLVDIENRGILFLDECHALPRKVQEHMFSAMEDRTVDIKTPGTTNKQIVSLKLNSFCLVGATTDVGRLVQPFRDRFGIVHQLDYYNDKDLIEILKKNLDKLKMGKINDELLGTLASRARGTPRIAIRLLKRIRDYAQVKANNKISPTVVKEALKLEGIDELGLDKLDRLYMWTLFDIYGGGPAGLNSVSTTMGEDKTTIHGSVEPYLTKRGFIFRAKNGRQLTEKGWTYVIDNLKKDKK